MMENSLVAMWQQPFSYSIGIIQEFPVDHEGFPKPSLTDVYCIIM